LYGISQIFEMNLAALIKERGTKLKEQTVRKVHI
jgi:hypothetical protein